MADVINSVLYGGGSGKAPAARGRGAGRGILWIVALAALAAVVFALASTGRLGEAGKKLRRGASELTGGWIGEKPERK